MANLNEILKMDKKTNEIGIYKLTPVEPFLINKNLPYGIKLSQILNIIENIHII